MIIRIFVHLCDFNPCHIDQQKDFNLRNIDVDAKNGIFRLECCDKGFILNLNEKTTRVLEHVGRQTILMSSRNNSDKIGARTINQN
jgi:hypothetical protein